MRYLFLRSPLTGGTTVVTQNVKDYPRDEPENGNVPARGFDTPGFAGRLNHRRGRSREQGPGTPRVLLRWSSSAPLGARVETSPPPARGGSRPYQPGRKDDKGSRFRNHCGRQREKITFPAVRCLERRKLHATIRLSGKVPHRSHRRSLHDAFRLRQKGDGDQKIRRRR